MRQKAKRKARKGGERWSQPHIWPLDEGVEKCWVSWKCLFLFPPDPFCNSSLDVVYTKLLLLSVVLPFPFLFFWLNTGKNVKRNL